MRRAPRRGESRCRSARDHRANRASARRPLGALERRTLRREHRVDRGLDVLRPQRFELRQPARCEQRVTVHVSAGFHSRRWRRRICRPWSHSNAADGAQANVSNASDRGFGGHVRKFDLIVLGGGSGGLATAQRAAEYGARVALFEPGAARRHVRERRLRAEESHVERGRARGRVRACERLWLRRARRGS